MPGGANFFANAATSPSRKPTSNRSNGLEIEVREVKIVGRSDDGSRIRSKRGNRVRCAAETGGEHDEIELCGISV